MATDNDIPPVVALFERASSTYDDVGVDFFSLFGAALVDAAGVGPTDTVLDVGCGTGATLIPAALAATDGSVAGIDLSPGMVARCEAAIAAAGLTNATASLGDAGAPDVAEHSFSILTCGLVIFFLPNPDAALDAYHRALIPGGRLALSTFGEEDPRLMPAFGAIAGHIPVDPNAAPPPRAQKGPFSSSEHITELLEAHRFTDVHHVEVMNEIVFADPHQWIDWSWSHGARVLWESIPEDLHDAAHAEAIAALSALAEPDGTIIHRWPLRYTTAVATD